MLGLFSRFHRKPCPIAAEPRRGPLSLEALEDRCCPTAPVLTLLAAPLTGTTVVLSGTVTDDNPASVTITFSGAASGTTTANAQGTYSFTTQATSLGTVSAVGEDGNSLFSNQASALVTTPAPNLTLSITYGAQHSVTLSGMVNAQDRGGRTV